MKKKYQKWDKLLTYVFNHPDQRLTVRMAATQARLPPSTTQRYLQQLQEEEILTKDNIPAHSAIMRFRKAVHLIEKLFESGLIEHLEKRLVPSAIVIFGSVRKGEYDKKSDIDLFVETTKAKTLNLAVFEKRIGHSIQMFIHKDIHELPAPLLNNVINGIKLSGYLKLK